MTSFLDLTHKTTKEITRICVIECDQKSTYPQFSTTIFFWQNNIFDLQRLKLYQFKYSTYNTYYWQNVSWDITVAGGPRVAQNRDLMPTEMEFTIF